MSIISQSGGLSIGMINSLHEENIGLAKLASIGNKLDLDEVDFLEYFGQDPQTGIICLYLESMDRGRDFIEVARSIDKPIVVYKSNTTSAGKKAAMSHTAAVSSDEDIIDSAFEEAGVIRISNFFDFVDLAKAFRLPPMRGRRIMVMSPAGGFSVVGADLCEKAGFEFAKMGQEFYDNLRPLSNAGVIQLSNPLDMGDIYNPEFIADVLYSVMQSDQVDGSILISTRPQMPEGDSIFHRMFLTDLSKELWGSILSSRKPLGVCLAGPSEMILQAKRATEFPIFGSPEEVVSALAVQMKYHERKMKRPDQKEAVSPAGIDRHAAMQWMQDKRGDFGEEALGLLAAYGIGVAASRVAAGKDEAVKYAQELGFPVVMKVVSPDALHKSDVGGVVVGVETPGQVEANFEIIRDNLLHYKADACFQGVRIQKMAPDGYDLFVGGKHDPSFGPVVFFGMGGIYIEVFRDVANALCPAGADSISSRLKRLKSYAVLNGLRGKAPGDVPSFVDLVVRVSLLLADFPGIRELDINPVRVFPPGDGVMALDTRVRIE
jgi:acetyltransferase